MSHESNNSKSAPTAESKRSARRAWDGDSPQVAAAQQRILEAAARCIARDGVAAASVGAIAAEAGVSRQTIYRYFAGREQLVLRSVRLAADSVRAKLAQILQPLSDPADMIVETVVFGLAEARSHPVLRAIWDSSSLDGIIATRSTGPAGIGWLRGVLAPAIEAAGWNEADADTALELIMRMILSLFISPSPERSPEQMRAFLYRHLVPGLGILPDEGSDLR